MTALGMSFMLPSGDALKASPRQDGGPSVDAACAPTADIHYICGVKNVEDLLPVAGGRWLVASSFETNSAVLYLIDTRNRTARPVTLSIAAEPDPAFPCPKPDFKALKTHGLDLREDADGEITVLAVNHGGRESVEMFQLDPASNTARWTGCIIAPPHADLNSVAALGDGRIAVTKMFDAGTMEEFKRLISGEQTGSVLIWTPGKGFAEMPGSRLKGNNGLLLSRDGKSLYVAEWGGHAVWRLPLAGTDAPARMSVDFWPDNIRWSAEGDLLVTGQYLELDKAGQPGAWAAIRLDPELKVITPVVKEPARAAFGMGGTSAVEAGGVIWFGTAIGTRIAYRLKK